MYRMPTKLTDDVAAARRSRVLDAARWCFLNFGFSKTSFEDIARRAGISRTLLYRTFRNKEDVFTAVFEDWLVARHPAAREAAAGAGSAYERLVAVCRVMVIEPWAEMVGAPMAGEFFDACERIDPEIEALHRAVARECAAAILGDAEAATVFLLALDGLLADEPAPAMLEHRVEVLAGRFVQVPANPSDTKGLP